MESMITEEVRSQETDCSDLVCRQDLDLSLAILPGQGGQLDLLRGQLGHVQGLGEDLREEEVESGPNKQEQISLLL